MGREGPEGVPMAKRSAGRAAAASGAAQERPKAFTDAAFAHAGGGAPGATGEEWCLGAVGTQLVDVEAAHTCSDNSPPTPTARACEWFFRTLDAATRERPLRSQGDGAWVQIMRGIQAGRA